MSATREHRNAGLIEDKIGEAQATLDDLAVLLKELAPVLPDDYPYMDVLMAQSNAMRAVQALWEVAA